MRKFSLLASLIIIQGFLTLPVLAQDADLENLVGPQPQIQIPGFQGFSDIVKETVGTQVIYKIPYLADYIGALYRWSLGAGAVIAAFFLTLAGVQWMLAGGETSKIKLAKARITNAVTGLLILVSSFVFLNAINPELTKLPAISVMSIPLIRLEEAETERSEVGVLFDENFDVKYCEGLAPVGEGLIPGPRAHMALRENAAKALQDVNRDWMQLTRKTGLVVNRAYRTKEEQQYLFDQYKADKGPKAAPPGKSNHERGSAVDIATGGMNDEEYQLLVRTMENYGFAVLGDKTYTSKNIPSNWKMIDERWHFDYKDEGTQDVIQCKPPEAREQEESLPRTID